MARTASVTVLVVDDFGIDPNDWDRLEAVTSEVFKDTKIQVDLVRCAPEGCEETIDRPTVRMSLVRGHDPKHGYALGLTVLEGESGSIRLFPEVVQNIAKQANWSDIDLLGHVAAHEIGHVLWGKTHSPVGIMRADWHWSALLHVWPKTLRFLPDQAKSMRETLFRAEAALRGSEPEAVE